MSDRKVTDFQYKF